VVYLTWSLPALVVVGLVASGRAGILKASIIGTSVALAVALLASPQTFQFGDARIALLRGAWIGWIVVPYILGGLFFWQMAIRPGKAAMPAETTLGNDRSRRRLVFAACFLIGPFAESVTGFGVGIIGTMTLVRKLGVKPIYLLAFSLLSQTMILWGAMGSGAIVGAAFAGTTPTDLVLHSSVFVAALNTAWLPLFWRLASQAGLPTKWAEHVSEAFWLASCLVVVIGATVLVGPEAAMLAAYGPIIVLRFLVDERPGLAAVIDALWRLLPFAAVIVWLVAIRLVQPLHQVLDEAVKLSPFLGAPVWFPLSHAGTWLIAAGLLTGLLRGHAYAFPSEMRAVWRTGRLAIFTVVSFAMMAEVLSISGIAAGLAQGLFRSLGQWAVVMTPILAGLFGVVTNSGGAGNGLFMASQIDLATTAGLTVSAVAALQHMSGLTMSMFSPVRMAIVCSLAGTPGMEGDAYRVMLPFAVATIAILLAISLLIALKII
jgi:lactate permease